MQLQQLLQEKREEIIEIATRYGARVYNMRLLGFAASGAGIANNKVDFLVEIETGQTLLNSLALSQKIVSRAIEFVEWSGCQLNAKNRTISCYGCLSLPQMDATDEKGNSTPQESELRSKIKKLEEIIKQQQAFIDRRLSKYNQLMATKDNLIATQNQIVAEKDRIIAELNESLKSLNAASAQ